MKIKTLFTLKFYVDNEIQTVNVFASTPSEVEHAAAEYLYKLYGEGHEIKFQHIISRDDVVVVESASNDNVSHLKAAVADVIRRGLV